MGKLEVYGFRIQGDTVSHGGTWQHGKQWGVCDPVKHWDTLLIITQRGALQCHTVTGRMHSDCKAPGHIATGDGCVKNRSMASKGMNGLGPDQGLRGGPK